MILHIPHSLRIVPNQVRDQFVVTDEELDLELTRMTDAFTDELFSLAGSMTVQFPVSRLVVDVERFEDDEIEPMSKVGMGKITMKTSHDQQLRRPLKSDEIEDLIARYYRPHHRALLDAVEGELASRGKALIVDCHSFPSRPLPCDQDQTVPRPDFCIGTDLFHTPMKLASLAVHELQKSGYKVDLNRPYAGAIVPMKFYGKDPRVSSIMIEVNRSLYLDEATGEKDVMFAKIGVHVTNILLKIANFMH